MKKRLFFIASIAAVAFSCTTDPDFVIDGMDKIDTGVTIFGNGIEVPIGQTDKIYLGQALKAIEDSTVREFFKEDKDGNYSLNLTGKYNLNDLTGNLDLGSVTTIDGVSFTQDISYNLEIDASLDGLEIPTMTAEKKVNTEFYKYLPDMDLGKQIANQDQGYELIDIDGLNSTIAKPEFSMIDGNMEVTVQNYLSNTSVKLDTTREVAGSLDLGENADKIAGLSNFLLKNGAKVTVSLSFENCPLTDGKVTPDLTVNLSQMMKVQGAGTDGDISLSSLVLNKSNGWKASKVLNVTSLADDFLKLENGKISFSGNMVLDGSIAISDAKSTKNKIVSLAGKKAIIKASVLYEDFVLQSVDITLGSNVKFETEAISIPVDFSTDLPEAVASVDSVILKSSKPMSLKLWANNLSKITSYDKTKHVSLVGDIQIKFPAGIAIDGCPDGVIKIKRDLYDGTIDTNIVIRGIKPVCSGGKVGFNGNVTASVKAVASGTFSSMYLPTSAVGDVVVGAKINYAPEIQDFQISLNLDKVSQSINYDCKDIIFLDSKTVADLPKEIKGVKDLAFNGVNANVELVLSGLPSGMNFSLKNAVITLPAFVYAADGTNKIAFEKSLKIENDKPVKTSAGLGGIKNVSLEGITEVKGDISFTADLVCETPNVSLEDLPEKVTGSVKVAVGDGKSIDDPGKIVVKKAVVSADYHLDQTSTESFGEVPSFLQSDSMNLAINPVMDLTFRTNLGIPLKAQLEIVPYLKGQAIDSAIVNIPDVELPFSENPKDTLENRYVIGTNVAPAVSDGTKYINCNLSNLVRRVPDSLKMRVKADIDKADSCIFYPDAKYVCGLNYTVNVPLKFDNGMNISFSESMEASGLEDLFNYVGRMKIDATVINTLPIGVWLELFFLDENGKQVTGFDKLEFRIKPGDGKTETVQNTGIDFNYSGKSATAVKSVLIKFRLESTANVSLRADQFIQIVQLKGILPEGVTIDPKNM